jgi:hypothetical protein
VRIWTYLDPLAPQVVFDATPTHERDGPETFLAGFAGDLQADAYTGYDALYRTGRIRELGCWAHARRRFVEALPTEERAAPMIALIQQLYQVERGVADDSAEIRHAPARTECAGSGRDPEPSETRWPTRCCRNRRSATRCAT